MGLEILRKLLNIIPSWGIHIERSLVALDLMDRKKSLILDIGCGNGGFSSKLVNYGKKVVGIDLIKKRPKGNFLYVIGRAEQLPFRDNIFEQIFCLDVIEHVKNDLSVAKETNRILEDDGKLIITTPSNFWKFPYYSFMKKITHNEKKLRKKFGHVRKGYSLGQIKNLFKSLKIEEVEYFCNEKSAFGYDIEFSRLYGIENIILKFLGFFLFLNFKLSTKKHGTHIGVRLGK